MSTRKEIADTLRAWASEMDQDTLKQHAALVQAADMLDPPDDGSTVEVRILCRVDVFEGVSYVAAAAYPGATEDDLFERVALDAEDNWTDDPHHSCVIARVPKPPPLAVIEGTVDL